MELPRDIELINQQLIDFYGIDIVNGLPIWRVVWSDDQLEKRLMDYTPKGVALLHPQVFEVRKYQYVRAKYILERLVIIPESDQKELPASKLSYEPLWVFQTSEGEFIPPVIQACKFVIDTVHAAQRGDGGMAKYVQGEDELTPEGREQIITELQEELFGNETETCDALRYHEGIVVPSNYRKDN